MSENNKSYRIRTDINSESPFYLNLNLNQDYKSFEILSLNIDSESLYKMFTAQYGCVVGRVLANDALGIPNAKISIFIPTKESNDIDPVLKALYPYETTLDKNDEHIRYNTLPDEIVNECHQSVGTFPNKRLVLDDNNVLEIFEKYYKYTTVSNASGDYMIYGVPVGEQTLHVDIDLSDIGELSQRPIDMMYKGYDKTQFESSSMFNKSTDIDKLPQIFSQNHQVYVKPFWGNDESQEVSITRCDISIQYKFEPTCIFIGSIITDSGYAGFSKKCVPSPEMGVMGNLVGTSGTIEIIRKTQGDNVESFVIQGTQLIDGSGKWCFQIPMNLDFVGTDEYGNRIATNDPNKGVPTRTRVRFRISSSHEKDEYDDLHISKVLVPHNPKTLKEIDYAFGDKTLDNEEASLSFRDLFKDNVYTVKSYIPRIQKGNGQRSEKFSGIKNVTDNNGNNSIPYNNMRVNITFMFILQCAILHSMIWAVSLINSFLSSKFWYSIWDIISLFVKLDGVELARYLTCITLGDTICPDMEGWYYAPNCNGKDERKCGGITLPDWLLKILGGADIEESDVVGTNTKSMTPLQRTSENLSWAKEQGDQDMNSIDFGNDDGDENVCVSNVLRYLIQCVEIHLAMEHNVIQFDFYNDWLNGTIYIPKWFAEIKQKRTYKSKEGVKREAKVKACMEDTFSNTRHLTQQCALTYKDNGEGGGVYNLIDTAPGCVSVNLSGEYKQKCHKKNGRKYIKILGKNGGVVHKEETIRKDYVYYLRPMELYEERLIFLFATDIVLLGSINKDNIYGIPYVFNGLTSSTYKFPTLLAMTNLQEESTQYTACSGKVVSTDGVEPTYGQDEDNDDGPEYMYTEYAGVDWGFVGPGQGGQDVNNINQLYFPGGHFLGISCFNSETNIKSCVNLSRACEIGTTFSQFAEIPYAYKNDSELEYLQYNANGLISRREITDSSYRNIFSSLNFNELKTIPNNETLQRENSFLSNFSYNFDGVLEKSVNNVEYKKARTLEPISTAPTNGNDTAYGTAFEDYDIDYYRFRFGTYRGPFRECFGGQELNMDNFTVTFLPIYNNSYYFYFGIKNGETAYDKLHNDYYSLCTNDSNSIPSIEISNITNNDFCEIDEGTAIIELSQLSSVYKIYFEYRENSTQTYKPYKLSSILFEDNTPTMSPVYYNSKYVSDSYRGASYLTSIYKKILFKDLLNGDYIIYVQMLNDSYEYKAEFSVERKGLREDPEIREIVDSISSVNFKNGITDVMKRTDTNLKSLGYITLIPFGASIKEYQVIHIENETVTVICSSDQLEYNNEDTPGYFKDESKNPSDGKYYFYVPSGDTRYYVNMIYNCPPDSPYKDVNLRTDYGFTISYGELPLDYYFTNPEMKGRILRKLLTGSININKLNGISNWYINEKIKEIPTNREDPHNTEIYAAARLAWLEYAMVYEKSLFKTVEDAVFKSYFDSLPDNDPLSATTVEVDVDNILLGFTTVDGEEPKYDIKGNNINFSSNDVIDIYSSTTLETLFNLSAMPIYLPTVMIGSEVIDGEKALNTDHYFANYFDKLSNMGYTLNFKDMFIPALYDYELKFIDEEEDIPPQGEGGVDEPVEDTHIVLEGKNVSEIEERWPLQERYPLKMANVIETRYPTYVELKIRFANIDKTYFDTAKSIMFTDRTGYIFCYRDIIDKTYDYDGVRETYGFVFEWPMSDALGITTADGCYLLAFSTKDDRWLK